MDCPNCTGKGEITLTQHQDGEALKMVCPTCNGWGTVTRDPAV